MVLIKKRLRKNEFNQAFEELELAVPLTGVGGTDPAAADEDGVSGRGSFCGANM